MNSPLSTKSLAFAERILDMSDFLLEPKEEWQVNTIKGKQFKKKVTVRPQYSVEVCVKQVTRSGTSMGANIAEGGDTQSIADMQAKFHISLKEARETQYWLELLLSRNVINQKMYDSLMADLESIIKMLVSSIKTLKQKKQ